MDFNDLKELLKADRSVRRFYEQDRISSAELREIIALTRYCASGRNMQQLRYVIITDEKLCDSVFPHLKWAGYLPDWDGPKRGERPSAYIIQLNDTRLGKTLLCDDGLQLQTITLGATAKGLAGCIIKSFNAPALKELLKIEDHYDLLYVLALGKGKEKVEIEDTDGTSDADIKYYRTEDGVHHVPKRPLEELIISLD